MGFPRQEHWSGLLLLSPGDLPDLEIKSRSAALQAVSLSTEVQRKPQGKCMLGRAYCKHTYVFVFICLGLQTSHINMFLNAHKIYWSEFLYFFGEKETLSPHLILFQFRIV